ncbi:hypothetical protein FQN54_003336 [Arachnomyces sp. PD_36]|nr:hypothetical protein FQN54_003336 [Arachnomyces sp. PD_36]
MVEFIPPPDPRTLLPPLLACLPAAFASPRPPPALLPLLSPILRQRVQLLSSTSSTSDSWLRLLCWDAAKAERIHSIVENTTFEPHPVSGEIEIEDDICVTYKRFDEETLRARTSLPEYNLTVWYVWCGGDQEGGGPAWRVAQLLPREEGQVVDSDDPDNEKTWSMSIGDANESARARDMDDALKAAGQGAAPAVREEKIEEEDDDDDYWAQYDATPARTPAVKQTSGLGALSGLPSNGQPNSDDSYFARYAEVQPAMDNDDPSADKNEFGESSLNGDALAGILRRQSESLHAEQAMDARAYTNGFHVEETEEKEDKVLSHPRPSSASSSNGSETVAKLEQSAENQSATEIGVKQHIGANIKSLFRLAKSTGMSRAEFDSVVKRELEVLCITDDEG